MAAGNPMVRTVDVVSAIVGQGGMPIVLKDHLEEENTGVVWWRYVVVGLGVTDQKIRTQVGDGPLSAQVDPTREAGEHGTVNDETLGAFEGEHEVTLHQNRMTKIYLDLILSNGHTHTELLVGLDRNRQPDFISLFEQDLVIHVLGDSDTLSHRVVEEGGGYDSGIVSGHFSDHDVSAEVPVDTQSVFTVTLYAGPGGSGLSVSRQVTVVNGDPAGSGEKTIGLFLALEPFDDPDPDNDQARWTLFCNNVVAGDYLVVEEKVRCNVGPRVDGRPSATVLAALEEDPGGGAYSDPPPTTSTDYLLDVVPRDTGGPETAEYTWTLKLYNAADELQDSAVRTIIYNSTLCPQT